MNNKEIDNRHVNNTKVHLIVFLIILLLILIILLIHKLGRIGDNYLKTSGEVVDNIYEIIVNDEDNNSWKNNKLNIFNNEKYNNKKIIAPCSKGDYKFYIINKMENAISYDINFSDEMSKIINMKYRLKINNVYIKGSKNNYVSLEELKIEDAISAPISKTLYTLEWNWEDNNKLDTIVGSSKKDEYYTLTIDIFASKINNN